MEETMNPVFISDKRFEERNIRCDQCSHYHMIDSGWGQCVESPPRAVVLGLFRNKINCPSGHLFFSGVALYRVASFSAKNTKKHDLTHI